MEIRIQSMGFELTDGLATYTRDKAHVCLARLESHIARLEIKLLDVNGPKGGEDKRCRVVVRLDRQPSIVVQETAIDLYEAIALCLHRVKRTVTRKKKRFGALQKRQVQMFASAVS